MLSGLSNIYHKIVLRHPVSILIALSLVLLFFAFHAKNFSLDSSADSLVLEDDKDLKIFREISDRYTVKEFLVVTFTPDEELFSPPSFERLRKLRDEIRQMDSVESVITILDIPLLKTSGVKLSEITEESVKNLEDPDIDVNRAKREILESPIYKDLILSADGRTTGLLINLKTDARFNELLKTRQKLLEKKRAHTLSPDDETALETVSAEYGKHRDHMRQKRHQDIADFRAIIQPYKSDGELHLGGVPMIADDMITFIKNDLVVFGIGVFIFIVTTLILIFRSIRWMVLPLLNCFFAVLIMVGVLGYFDWKVTVISSNFTSLMLILTLSMNIHLAVRYLQFCRESTSETQIDLVLTTVRKMVWPCLYTALTTILAFSTLVFSGIKPVIDFGWMMTMGLAVTFMTSFILFPSVLVLLSKSKPTKKEKHQSGITSRLASFSEFHGNKIMLLSVLLAIVSMIGISRLKVENSFINYFSQKTEIYQGMKLLDEKLGGTNPLDVILSFKGTEDQAGSQEDAADTASDDIEGEDDFNWVTDYDPMDYWFTPFKINAIKTVHDYLDGLPEIGKVLSFVSVLRATEDLNGGRELDSLELALLYKKFPEQIKSDMINAYISVENNEARISLRILDSLEDIRRKELIEKIRNDLSEKFGFSENRATVSGVLVLYNNMLQSLFRSQILTLGTVMLGIALMFLILFRSVTLCVIGIIPNLLAVGIVLGIMGLLKIPLDMMTITIAAITMGIGVDNSIHYIYRFREEFPHHGHYPTTMRVCHSSIGRAILNTSTTIIFGFSILVMSNFVPTIYFGIFTGLAMFIALLATLTLLPKLILICKPFGS